MDSDILVRLVIVLVPMILSLTVHEFAHAWSAYKLGDDTAYRQGRMTLNPISHIDPIGTLAIPIFSVLSGGISLIGWAKPVPVSPYRFRRDVTMHKGMIITALAGPASNLLLAFLFGGVLMFIFSDQIDMIAQKYDVGRFMAVYALGNMDPKIMILSRVFILNIGLAMFNMLPVPPLDGSRVLPEQTQQKMARFQMLVFIGLILMINFAPFILSVPITAFGNAILAFFAIFV